MLTQITYRHAETIVTGDGSSLARQSVAAKRRDVSFSDGNVAVGTSAQTYARLDEPGVIAVPEQLSERVLRSLRGLTRVTENGSPRMMHLTSADRQWATSFDLPTVMRPLVTTLLDRAFGQISYRSTRFQLDALAAILRLYHSLSVMVVCRSRKAVRRLVSELRRRSGRQDVVAEPREAFAQDVRVIVTTQYHFEGVNQSDWQIAVFVDEYGGVPSLSEFAWTKATWLSERNTQLYMLRPCGLDLTAAEELRLEAVFGPVIYTQAADRQVASVSVLTAFGPVRPLDHAAAANASLLACKRASYWQHQKRNHIIAQIATAFSTKNVSQLITLGLYREGDYQRVTILIALLRSDSLVRGFDLRIS